MYYSLVFRNGITYWITEAEFEYLNHLLLNGEQFVDLKRVNRTFNAETISYIGPNEIFSSDKVKGAEFTFTKNAVFAKTEGGVEYANRGDGWKVTRDEFKNGVTFAQLIKDNTL